MKKKITIAVVCAVLSCVCLIGTTFAWLVDKTDPIKNTFTYGDIDITLAETTTTYKMVPGNTVAKDPVVTVLKESEDCWVFVKIEKSTNFDNFMEYALADGWTALDGVPGVYYRTANYSEATDQEFHVLDGDVVNVKEGVTREQLTALTDATLPTLTFTAYAVQRDGNITTAADAWAKVTP